MAARRNPSPPIIHGAGKRVGQNFVGRGNILESSRSAVAGIVRVPSAGQLAPDSPQLSEANLRMNAQQGVIVLLWMNGHGYGLGKRHFSYSVLGSARAYSSRG